MKKNEVKKDFVIFSREVNGKKLVYLDNAATTQKPEVVLESMNEYYRRMNANVHRGVHQLGDESTRAFENGCKRVAEFFGADERELVWSSSTTAAINLVAFRWLRELVRPGEIFLVSEAEHHANFVVWQELARLVDGEFRVVEVDNKGLVDESRFEEEIQRAGEKLAVVAVSAVSNVTGQEMMVERLVKKVRQVRSRAWVIVDGAQASGLKKIEFGKMGVDCYCFSGHKMYGPMGVGGVLVRRERLEELSPLLYGGGMVDQVGLEESRYLELPERQRAGTPNVVGVVGLAAACEYLDRLGMAWVEEHNRELVGEAVEQLSRNSRVRLVGDVNGASRLGSVAFVYEGVHAHDVAQVLDHWGIEVRSGHHCTMPLHKACGWQATTRISFGVYNSREEIGLVTRALEEVDKVFRLKGSNEK